MQLQGKKLNTADPHVPAKNQTHGQPEGDIGFIRLPQVKEITGLSKTSLYELMRKQQFPEPVRLGLRSVAWVRSEVNDWARRRVEMSRSVTIAPRVSDKFPPTSASGRSQQRRFA